MALRAGYYGLKRSIKNKLTLLAASTPADISPDNPIAGKNDVTATVDLMKDTTGWIGGNELPPDIIHLATSGSGIGETTLTTDASATAFVGELKSNTDYVVKAEGGNRFRVALATTTPANGTSVNIVYDNAGNRIYEFNSGSYSYIYLLADYQGSGTVDTIKPMVITSEQYNLNPAYRPYHESVEEMLTSKVLPNNTDLNNYLREGDYICDATVNTYTNIPPSVNNTSFRLKIMSFNVSASRCVQIIIVNKAEPVVYMRTNFGGTWQSWYIFTGTEVTPASLTKEDETKKATKKKL